MSDGIIQQVFNAHKEIRDKQFVPTTHFGLDYLFEQLQTELIEKIKQIFPIDYDENYSMWHEAIQKILIGDNQE